MRSIRLESRYSSSPGVVRATIEKESGRGASGGGYGSSSGSSSYNVGDKVIVDYERTGEMYPGKISRARPNGTYDVLYDDLDTESNVESTRINLKATGRWTRKEHELFLDALKKFGKVRLFFYFLSFRGVCCLLFYSSEL